jgi:hypothetical protein
MYKVVELNGFANGIECGGIKIDNMGNGTIFMLWCTSIISCTINGVQMPLTYYDRFRLEETLKWWFKNECGLRNIK